MTLNSSTLNEVNEVVSRRITQLRSDISEAEVLLASYRAELETLLKIAEVTAPSAVSNSTAPEPAPEPTVFAPSEPSLKPIFAAPPRRWSRVHLPPRYVRFIDRFSDNDRITRDDIRSWCRQQNPNIQDNSVETSVWKITHDLTEKRLLKSLSDGTWVVVR